MLIRLQSSLLLPIEDKLVDLSQFLSDILKDEQPIRLLGEALRNSQYKSVKPFFVSTLESMVQSPMNDRELKQLCDPESRLCQELRQRFEEQSEQELLQGALQYVHTNIDTIFDPVIHHLKFLNDESITNVVEFLQIPCMADKRNDNMFEVLPSIMQGCPPGSDLKAIVDPALHAYIDYIREIKDQDFKDLSKAAVQLGIPALQDLIGCQIAFKIAVYTEEKFRSKYSIAPIFSDPTLEKLRKLLYEREWIQKTSNGSETSQDKLPVQFHTPPSFTQPN